MLGGTDALHRGSGGGDGGHVRNLLLDGLHADEGVVNHAGAVHRSIDDQVNLLVGDHVAQVRAAFMQLVDHFRFHALAAQVFRGASGGDDLEAQDRTPVR